MADRQQDHRNRDGHQCGDRPGGVRGSGGDGYHEGDSSRAGHEGHRIRHQDLPFEALWIRLLMGLLSPLGTTRFASEEHLEAHQGDHQTTSHAKRTQVDPEHIEDLPTGYGRDTEDDSDRTGDLEGVLPAALRLVLGEGLEEEPSGDWIGDDHDTDDRLQEVVEIRVQPGDGISAAAPWAREGTWDTDRMKGRLATASLSIASLALLYFRFLRDPVLTWGATATEAAENLPGDELLDGADGCSTRALSIDAPPSAVWPWLAQMGPSPRGGVYTYDWIENLLGLDIHSVDHILPEFQNPKEGDSIPLGPNRMEIARLEQGSVLCFRSDDGNWVWAFILRPEGSGTRLISRNRFRLDAIPSRVGMLPLEPGSLVMERKMLLGIKRRAEALAGPTGT